ncbi:MAG: Ig-like domain-containing protein, partial [Pseudobdellovibrionaceae bacterium]|nr:Ig-like domain-containing protein [Pseudobdellovibrionaceae bacterium]
MQKGEIFQEKIRKFSYTFGYSIVPALITMILGSCHSETVIDRLYGKYMSKTLVVINGRMEIEEDSSPVVINIDYSSNQSIHPESCELIDPPSAINILSPCVCINKQCSFKAQPTQNFYGQTSINVQLTDQFGQKSNKGTIILDVTPVNDPPTLQTITDQSIQEDTSLHLEIEAQDIDSELSCSDSYFTASWSNSQLGTHATLSVGGNWPNCQISLTPSPNAFGSSSVTLSLTDGIASTSQSFNVNVQAVNDPPIAQNASFEIQEDTEAIIDLPYVDPDNEPATSCSVTNTDRVAITESCQCVGGVCTVKVLGDIFYNGVAKFDFAVVTNDEDSNTATITLNIADSGIIPRVEKLTVGTWSSCALLSNQRVRCWGFKGARMGSGIMGSPQNQLIGHTVFGLTKVVDLVTGSLGACALRENHSVWCWGEGSSGFIGNGALSNSLVPAKVSFSSDIKISKLAKGGNHSHNCAISDQKKLYCWGAGESGKIGNGTTVNQSSPVEISSLTQVEAVAVGANNTCALVNNDNNPTNGHQLYCWGRNNNGQVGNGSSGADVLSPVFIMDGVTDVSLANATSCAHLADKSLRCWGQRSVGASGTTTGPVFSMLSSPTLPVLKQDGNPLLVENEGAQFIAGSEFVAILEGLSNKLWAWGRNRSGTLGGMQPILWAANQVYHSRSFNQISGSEDLLCGVFNNKQSIECYGTSQAFEGGDTLSDLIGPTLSNFSLTDHLHHTVNENLSAFVTSNGS